MPRATERPANRIDKARARAVEQAAYNRAADSGHQHRKRIDQSRRGAIEAQFADEREQEDDKALLHAR